MLSISSGFAENNRCSRIASSREEGKVMTTQLATTPQTTKTVK